MARRPSGGDTAGAPRDVLRGPPASGATPGRPEPPCEVAGVIHLPNGARVYVDVGHHPELSPPGTP